MPAIICLNSFKLVSALQVLHFQNNCNTTVSVINQSTNFVLKKSLNKKIVVVEIQSSAVNRGKSNYDSVDDRSILKVSEISD